MSLPKYYIPRDLERAIKENDRSTTTSINKFSPVLKKLKNVDCLEIAECHYLQFLKLGLYLEEYQQRKDMRKIEILGSTIEKVQSSDTKKLQSFKICIKGLDEDNPILNVSDTFKVYEESNPNRVYFLKISEICKNHVIVTDDNKSQFCGNYRSSTKYNIVLIFNTYTFQCCHYALTTPSSSMISQCFFPEKTTVSAQKINYTSIWFNRGVLSNPEQKQAVSNIINKSAFPAPYILYGPPGTGKTSTLVEAICQIWKQQSSNCILVCAPSNAACDVITKRLLDYIPTKTLYRIYSQSQEYYKIDADIRKCCNYDEKGEVHDLKVTHHLSDKKIFVTTLCTSLRLKKLNFPFSYVFIDEASQATLPEAFLPLCAVKASRNFQIVISGDHQQLGPGIRSKLAEPILGQSILEKLMKRDPYKKDEKTGYDPRYVTKLIRNFRSSKDIIHVPNVLFYDNELIACSNEKKSSTFPVTFYAVEGKECKFSDSKSSYNKDEINKVLVQVKSFVGKKIGNKIISKKDIGIVTPFSLQVSQIRKRLNRTGLKDVDVGTVETYQGQEKEVIIVTTVRSKIFTHNGIEHIGFLSNPRRFNVALTRAKSVLVVVGSPSTLQINKYWRYFLRFCQKNNACRGDSFKIKSELYYSMQELSIGSECIKSTDLFERSLKVLTIDDGCTTRTRGNKNRGKNMNPWQKSALKAGLNKTTRKKSTIKNRPI